MTHSNNKFHNAFQTTRQAEEFADAVIGFMGNLPAVPPAEEAGSGGGSGLAGLMQVCCPDSVIAARHVDGPEKNSSGPKCVLQLKLRWTRHIAALCGPSRVSIHSLTNGWILRTNLATCLHAQGCLVERCPAN